MIKKFIIIFNLLFAFLAVPSKAAFDINARTAILQDFLSGEILFEKEIDSVIYPASMTKIMTSIVVFDLLKSGDLSLDDKVMVSENCLLYTSDAADESGV